MYHVRILLMLSVCTDEVDCIFLLYLLVAQLKTVGHFLAMAMAALTTFRDKLVLPTSSYLI
jgi:hypothetical protein